jgi:hypothetical protein
MPLDPANRWVYSVERVYDYRNDPAARMSAVDTLTVRVVGPEINGWVPVEYEMTSPAGMDTDTLGYLDTDTGLYVSVPMSAHGRFPLMKARAGTDTVLFIPGPSSASMSVSDGAEYTKLADSTITWGGGAMLCHVAQRALTAVADTALTFYSDSGVIRQDRSTVTQISGTDTLDFTEAITLLDLELN